VARMRERFVDSPTSLGTRMRKGRWQLLAQVFPEISRLRVLDLGGTAGAWIKAPVQPREVVILNIAESELQAGAGGKLPAWISTVEGNACAPPDVGSVDLVYSNSLIEHLGGPERRAAFAAVVARLASRHWIQTPYRYFPIEPHWLFPGFQFLPLAARASLSRSWPLMHTRSRTWEESVGTALNVDLIGATEMRFLFPRSAILRERIGPLTKSLIAVRR
jgi:hypothetical protein